MIDTCGRAREEYSKAAAAERTAQVTMDEGGSGSAGGRASLLETLLSALQDDAAASGYRGWLGGLETLPADKLPRSGSPEYWAACAVPLARQLLIDSMPPSSVHLVGAADASGAAREANALRERVMCERILALCGGAMSRGKPRKRVVAVVGRAHVMPLRALLLSARGDFGPTAATGRTE